MKIKGKVKAVVLALTVCLGATLVGCSGNKTTKIEQIKKSGKIVLGTSAEYPPYEFVIINKDGKDEIVGFDIELAKEIAKDLEVELEIKNMDFEGLIPSLKTGQIDFVISGMTPTEDRKKEIDFSNMYYKAIQSVMVKDKDKDKYKSVDSLTGVRIGAQTTSIQEDIAKEEIKDAKVTSLARIPELVISLKTDKVDAVIVENPVAKGHVTRNSDLAIADIKIGDENGGSAIGVQKGQQDFVEAINKTIDRLIAEGKIEQFVTDATNLSITTSN